MLDEDPGHMEMGETHFLSLRNSCRDGSVTSVDDNTGTGWQREPGEPNGTPWTVKEGFLEEMTVYCEICQSEMFMMTEAECVLVTALSPVWYLGHGRHPKYTH